MTSIILRILEENKMAEEKKNILDDFKVVQGEDKKFGKVFKLAIIGTGGIAGAYANEINKMDDVHVVALADLVDGKAEKFAQKYGWTNVNFYPSHKELIDAEKELDGVIVATYNRTHAECCIYALNAGLNVICEKPMSVTLEEAVEMR